jgi:hypothetical protein
MLLPSSYFSPEDGFGMYLRNIGNTTHIRAVQKCKNRTNKIRMISSRKIILAGHVASMGEKKIQTSFWWEDLRKNIIWKM